MNLPKAPETGSQLSEHMLPQLPLQVPPTLADACVRLVVGLYSAMGPKRVVINQEETKNNNAQRGRKGSRRNSRWDEGEVIKPIRRKTMDQNSKINRKLAGQPVSYFLYDFQVV